MSKTVYENTSPYNKTNQVSKYVNYLDHWQGTYIFPNSSDLLVQLDHRYNLRPDLLSYAMYGTPQLWWIFPLRNPDVIKDPIWDFKTGITIYVPMKDTLTRFL